MHALPPSEEHDHHVALFDALFETHRHALYAFHLGRAGDAEAAADLLQETFARAWKNIANLAPLSSDERRYWLFRAAKNLAIDHHRRAPQPPKPLDDELNLPACDGDPAQTLEVRDMAGRIQAAMAQLPAELRVVLALQVMGGLNSREIGSLLDKPAGTVRYQISEARRRLSAQLGLDDEYSS